MYVERKPNHPLERKVGRFLLFRTALVRKWTMGIFFGKQKKTTTSRVTQQDKAILQLKQTRDKIKQYQRRIEQDIEKERLIAKKLIQNGQKDRALLLLRKKKYREQLLSKTDGQLENLEVMVHDIEFAQVEMKVLDGLKEGNTALKALQRLLSIDDIERVMDDTREAVDKQREIDEMLGGGVLSEDDETEVEAELDRLMAEETGKYSSEEVANVPKVPEDSVALPEVPEEVPEVPGKEKATRKRTEAVALEA